MFTGVRGRLRQDKGSAAGGREPHDLGERYRRDAVTLPLRLDDAAHLVGGSAVVHLLPPPGVPGDRTIDLDAEHAHGVSGAQVLGVPLGERLLLLGTAEEAGQLGRVRAAEHPEVVLTPRFERDPHPLSVHPPHLPVFGAGCGMGTTDNRATTTLSCGTAPTRLDQCCGSPTVKIDFRLRHER